MKNRYIQIFSCLIALLSFATFPACELDDKINFVTEGGINDVDTGSVDTGYVSLIDITDNTDADWKTLPAGYVASATHSNGCSLNGLKSVKVYSDQKYLNILVEVNLEVVTDRAWTPFHVFLNADGSDATGGFGDIFTDANTDIMLETAIYAEGHAQYNPAVFKWWGEVGGSGWIWTNPNIESVADNCWGAIVCERSYPAVGYAQSVNADRSRIEIQILKERIPTQWANEFTIGFGIQQSWADVGVLPNAPDENGQSFRANKLKVKTYMPHNTATYENGHEYVDLGLSVKWATCNVGANKPEDSGDYFAWGETTTKDTYNWSTYKWCNGSYSTLTKYCNNSSYGNNGFTDNTTQLWLSDDAAHVNWGGSWRMPTDAEWTELREQCTWTWTTQKGVKGYKITSNNNGNSIFLSAAGYRYDSSIYRAGSSGNYWSSSLNTDYPSSAWSVDFDSGGVSRGCTYRYYGQSVRPVLGETTIPTVTTTIPTQITETTAVAGGNVTSDGNASVTERGVVFATKQNPTTDDNKLTCGSGMGEFTCNLTGLQANTTYYVRAYAVNSKGTAYGEEVSFSTESLLSEPTGMENGYGYVDLGLSVKWATMNVGASKVEDYGSYFAWGEVEPKDYYDWSTYRYCNGSDDSLTKYCNKSSYGNNGFTDNKTQLELSDDAARANWGGAWRMPTDAEWTELREQCTWTWTTQNGVYGRKVTSKSNGNSIFLPAAGFRRYSSLLDAGSGCSYWSSLLLMGDPSNACALYFNSDYVYRSYSNRYYGKSVRPVLGESVVETTIPTVTTTIPTQITETSAVAGGNVTADGNASVTERGVVYGKSPNPTISNLSNTIRPCGSGLGEFTYNMTDLQPSTTYYVRAYATNEKGTAYGEEVSFTTKEQSSTPNNGTENGYAYVDLGLSVKWATCNVGANNPEDYGDYFAWGETTTKDTYYWSTYKYCNVSSSTLTKYCNNSSYGNNGFTDNKTQLELSDDAARANWGDNWRMPTDAEWKELINNCTWTWTTQNGVYGRKATSKTNGNSIFLPVAGCRSGSSLDDAGSFGYYWSSALHTGYPDGAWGVYFGLGSVDRYVYDRYDGRSVRPVCP